MAQGRRPGKEVESAGVETGNTLVQTVNVQLPQFSTEKRLCSTQLTDPAGVGKGSGTIYTVPLSTVTENAVGLTPRAVITSIYCTERNCTMDLHHVPAGGSAGASNLIISGLALTVANAPKALDIVLQAGDFIAATNFTSSPGDSTATVHLNGTEFF